MITLTEVLQHFAPAKRVGPEKYRTVCPVHGGGSLVITGGSTHILFKCWAMNCPLEALLSAVGLTLADVSPSLTTNEPAYVAIHDYCDTAGVLRYQVVQLPTPPGAKKSFKQRRSSGNGHAVWIWDLQGVTRLPFRLPDLKGHARVFICEGEKDVNRLWSLGLPATCNSGGAGKWSDVESAALKAIGVQRAVLLQDFDAPGAAHVVKVAAALATVGITSITLPPFPDVPATGGDVSDWIDAGHTVTELEALILKQTPKPTTRVLQLTSADTIMVKPVHWLWHERIALGTLCLVGGREGVGKSIITYTLAAQITQGTLPGVHFSTPRAVIVAASEDSWEHTIVPRLMAAGADLARVFRVDVLTPEGTETALSLPKDLREFQRVITETHAALVIFDPLLSRLDAALDTHKDAEVRQGLEPVVTIAQATQATVIGLIHVNKSASSDPLTLLMGSRAFAAVARSVLFVMADPEDTTKRLLGQAKNNLGRGDLPTLAFHIKGIKVADTPEGEVWTGIVEWLGETTRTISDAVVAASANPHEQTAVTEAADWLGDFLESAPGPVESVVIKRAAGKSGHSAITLQRARVKLQLVVTSVGYPRKTYWALPDNFP